MNYNANDPMTFELTFAESASGIPYVLKWIDKDIKDKKIQGYLYSALENLEIDGDAVFDYFEGLSVKPGRRIKNVLFREFCYSWNNNEYRILYVVKNREFRMIHGFIKKDERIREKEFKTAYQRYWRNYGNS